jgi:hypothetical protein
MTPENVLGHREEAEEVIEQRIRKTCISMSLLCCRDRSKLGRLTPDFEPAREHKA